MKPRKKHRAEDKGTSEEDEDTSGAKQDAAQVLGKTLPAAAPQDSPAAEPPADSAVRVDSPSKKGRKGSQANTLRQLGKELKAPVDKPAPRQKRGGTGSSSDALL